jgi:hypothetical protein
MVKKTKLSLREIFLFGFVIVSVVFVGIQWGQGIIGEEDHTPDFVRPTAAFEVDEEMYENWNQLEVTPTHQHQYQDTDTPEPFPTATP